MKFLHTADWQLGKPYGQIEDTDKRGEARLQRVRVIEKLAVVARETEAEFVVVAGDLFDSSSVSKATVSQACAAIGKIPAPVYVIPGNHDHGGPGSIWEQEFYKREAESLAPNLRILLNAEPVELETAVLFPCPLLRRSESLDTSAWVRDTSVLEGASEGKVRIILAHGATVDFGAAGRDEEDDAAASNFIDLKRLPMAQVDYVALGDWHGTREIEQKAWYSGTPESDRFPRGAGYDSGNVLLVEAERGQAPQVEKLPVGRFQWRELSFHLNGEDDVEALKQVVETEIGARAGEDFLRLILTGNIGIGGRSKLDELLETLRSRLLRLKVSDQLQLAPSEEELLQLQDLPHPIIKRVAAKLIERSKSAVTDEARVARHALLELFLALPKT